MMRRRKNMVTASAMAALAVAAAGCSSGGTTSAETAGASSSAAASGAAQNAGGSSSGSLTIALQPDLGYAPLMIVAQEHWLQHALPGTNVEWQSLNSGSAIESGMISGHIDVGAGGIAPFLLGADGGVGWKLLASLGEQDLWLVCKPKIKTLKDISANDRISVVAPTSIQAINVKKAAQQALGKATALDSNLVILSHGVSLQAFKAGRTTCALDAPPFEQQEVAAGGHIVTSSYKLFGQSTFDSTFVLEKFYKSHKHEMNVLATQIKRAVKMLNAEPAKAAQLISSYEKGELTESQAKKQLTTPGTIWTTVPHGYLKYAQFMHSIGLIKKMPSSIADLELATLSASPGN